MVVPNSAFLSTTSLGRVIYMLAKEWLESRLDIGKGGVQSIALIDLPDFRLDARWLAEGLEEVIRGQADESLLSAE